MADIKEKYTVDTTVGVINADDPQSAQQAVENQILSALAGIKARGFTSAILKLKFIAKLDA